MTIDQARLHMQGALEQARAALGITTADYAADVVADAEAHMAKLRENPNRGGKEYIAFFSKTDDLIAATKAITTTPQFAEALKLGDKGYKDELLSRTADIYKVDPKELGFVVDGAISKSSFQPPIPPVPEHIEALLEEAKAKSAPSSVSPVGVINKEWLELKRQQEESKGVSYPPF